MAPFQSPNPPKRGTFKYYSIVLMYEFKKDPKTEK